MTGKDKAKAVAEKLKAEVPKPETAVEKPLREGEMAVIDEKMRAMMMQDAKKDVEENGAILPFLSVYVANRSTSKLANGQDPQDGNFYLSSTQEEFKDPLVHIFHISRGFRQLKKDDKGGQKAVYEHLVSGVIMDDQMKPFFMHVSGSHRLELLWDFRNAVRKLNNRGIPTFSLLVKLETEKISFKADGQDRVARVIHFDMSRDTTGNPEVIDDPELYMQLREKAADLRSYEDQYIQRVEVDRDGNSVIKKAVVVEEAPAKSEEPPAIAGEQEDVNPDDIPF